MNIDWGRLLPQFWFQSAPTNWEYDRILNDLIDDYGIFRENMTDEYVAIVGPLQIWTANYSYSYGEPFMPKSNILPSTKTRWRIKKLLEKQKSDPLSEIKSIIEKNK